jgi:PAS domain-containing protein
MRGDSAPAAQSATLTPLADSETLQGMLSALADGFGIRERLATLFPAMTETALERLAAKIAVMQLDERVNPRADAPYVSVWEAGQRKKIRMVYINAAIERITGFSAREVLDIGFNIFVPDDLITRYRQERGGEPHREEIPIEAARSEREAQALDPHWERTYEILTRRGTAFVKDLAEIECVAGYFISTGTLVDVTAEVRLNAGKP